jgi:hypothetical protein
VARDQRVVSLPFRKQPPTSLPGPDLDGRRGGHIDEECPVGRVRDGTVKVRARSAGSSRGSWEVSSATCFLTGTSAPTSPVDRNPSGDPIASIDCGTVDSPVTAIVGGAIGWPVVAAAIAIARIAVAVAGVVVGRIAVAIRVGRVAVEANGRESPICLPKKSK